MAERGKVEEREINFIEELRDCNKTRTAVMPWHVKMKRRNKLSTDLGWYGPVRKYKVVVGAV